MDDSDRARRRQFEQELKDAEANCDPLSAWWSYISWFEEKKLTSLQVYSDVIQQCIRYFIPQSEYNGDMRLIKIYLKSANVCKDPLAIYNHMLGKGIGIQFALFYEKYAATLCDKGQFEEAITVLRRGIQANVKQHHVLQSNLDTLQKRNFQKLNEKTGNGLKYCYPKAAVYPPSGEELQLEQVRAQLPQYMPSFQSETDDMELTCTYTSNISIQHSYDPPLGNSLVDQENVQHHPGISSEHGGIRERKPLKTLQKSPISVDDQLELLCKDKSCPFPDLTTSTKDIDVEFEQQMDQLILDKDNMSTASCRGMQQEDKKVCVDQYGFTPDTLEGGMNWPTKNLGRMVNTKLSFTDAESMLSMSSHSHLIHNDDSESRCTSLAFNATSDLERKAKILCSQQNRENEYMLTEFERVSDKYGEKVSNDGLQINSRRVLQPVTTQKSFCDYSYTSASQNSYEDSHNESSFIPYHDSMHASTSFKNSSRIHDTSLRTYCAPLGVCLHSEQQQPLPAEQSFTQFDIPHPNKFDSVSTPSTTYKQQNLTWDLSVIPTTADDCKEDKVPVSRLSTIIEESSGSSKFTSSSSSRFTVSSSNSSTQSQVSGSSEHHHLAECNPFLPDIVNRMLNSLGGLPQDIVEELVDPTFPIIEEKGVVLKGQSFHSMSVLADGIFSKIYLVSNDIGKKVLKVHKVPLDWEVTITNRLLPQRLKTNGLQELSNRFQHCDRVYQLPGSCISLSSYYPHGSVQDVINKYAFKKLLECSVVLFLGSEMLSLVEYLHQCRIIHAALKPAHFLICNLSESPGLGLHLIDFKQSVDTKQFSDDQLFHGVPANTPMCPSFSDLVRVYPWKWQIDYYGLAMSIMALFFNGVPTIMKSTDTGLYTWSNKPPKKFDTPLWKGLIEKLLNPNPNLSLREMELSLREKLTLKDYKYSIRPSLLS